MKSTTAKCEFSSMTRQQGDGAVCDVEAAAGAYITLSNAMFTTCCSSTYNDFRFSHRSFARGGRDVSLDRTDDSVYRKK